KKQPRLDRFGDPLPGNAIVRLGTARFRHGDQVVRIIFSPDGKLLATSGNDPFVRIWEADTGKELHCCVGHTGHPISVAFSPDGRNRASGGSDNTIRIWSTATGKEFWQWKCNEQVWSVAYSPDGKTLASGSLGKLVLWDMATRQERRTLCNRTSDPVAF